MEEVDRLEAEYTAARAAVVEHLRSAAVSWYGDPPRGPSPSSFDETWRDRDAELKVAAAEARTRADEGMDAFVREQVARRS
jgi:hypothetical protein